MSRHETTWRTFHIVGGQWVGKTPPQPKPAHILAARTPVHEDVRRDHDAPVVTAEKVVIARQKARALTVSSGMLWAKRSGNGTSALQNVFLPQPVTHSKMRILKSVNGLVTDQSVTPVRTIFSRDPS